MCKDVVQYEPEIIFARFRLDYPYISPWIIKILYLTILKKFINNSRGKYKRNECLINVCKSDTDLS